MDFEVIVVGGGHAGCEAALASAKMGLRTALITLDKNQIGQTSCNPAIGGVAKGQLVKEIDALGGVIGYCTDMTGIQFRMLNRSKGPAVWSRRAQIDRRAYRLLMSAIVHSQSNLTVIEDDVIGLVCRNGRCCGVTTVSRETISAEAVVLCHGTFLNGLIHIGEKKIPAGRWGEPPSTGMTQFLVSLGFEAGRLKTGTPPRLDGNTIDFSLCQLQDGDEPPPFFSLRSKREPFQQSRCYLLFTNDETHRLIRENIHLSAMYSGRIRGIGPRYCPSVEDKVMRFSDKDRHQLFLEPEGVDTTEYYINGFSSSLPEEVQLAAARTIPALREVRFTRPGYAIEYDFFPPHQLYPTLETKRMANLFFAGQINGTSGYEEAAAQGIIAGINAALKVKREPPLVLDRSQAYIGVLIDDLVTKSTDEPYRMFTSRAEYRLFLRDDNVTERLAPIGYRLGLLDREIWQRIEAEAEKLSKLLVRWRQLRVRFDHDGTVLTVADAAKRPDIPFAAVYERLPGSDKVPYELFEKAMIRFKYEGYLAMQQKQLERFRYLESRAIPAEFDYGRIVGLKKEAAEKLQKYRPSTLGQAARISGVSPGDLAVLLVYLARR